MNILLPTAILNQLLIPFGNFYFFFKPSFSAHTVNTKHTPSPNAPTTSNSYTKVIYRLSTIMPTINPTQPSTQLKMKMRSNEPLMTLNSCPLLQILLLPLPSPTMPPKPNTLLTKTNTNTPSKHYAKLAPSLLSMYLQYNIPKTLYIPNYTLAIPCQQPDTTPDPINNTNKPKPLQSNTSPSLSPFVL
jgi:hypothetical protein